MAGFINPMGGFNGRPQTGMQGIAMRPSVSMPMQPNMPLMPQRPPTGGPHPYPMFPLPQRPPTGGPHPTQTPIPSRPQMMANALMGRR